MSDEPASIREKKAYASAANFVAAHASLQLAMIIVESCSLCGISYGVASTCCVISTEPVFVVREVSLAADGEIAHGTAPSLKPGLRPLHQCSNSRLSPLKAVIVTQPVRHQTSTPDKGSAGILPLAANQNNAFRVMLIPHPGPLGCPALCNLSLTPSTCTLVCTLDGLIASPGEMWSVRLFPERSEDHSNMYR